MMTETSKVMPGEAAAAAAASVEYHSSEGPAATGGAGDSIAQSVSRGPTQTDPQPQPSVMKA